MKINKCLFTEKKYWFSTFVILNILLQILLFSSFSYNAENMIRTEQIICENSEYQTAAYFFSSIHEGPTVMIIAGVHGDELAGIKATKKIMETLEPEKGTVIIIPEANKQACENRVRTMPKEEDLNRIFPGDPSSQGIACLAAQIFEIMEINSINFLLDLHESVEHYQENPSHYGQTIILDDINEPFLQEISDYLVNKLNSIVTYPENYFEVIAEPIEGCSTYEALSRLGIPGITFETSTKMDLSKRVALHYHCIRKTLSTFDIIPLSHAK